jgi:mitochondrial fission protein ELM1
LIDDNPLEAGEVWVLTDGRPGHVSQTLGLAEHLCDAPIVKTLGLRSPYRQLSPFLGWAGGRALTAGSSPIAPPWPRLVITSGRPSLPVALAIGKASKGRALLVNVQNPSCYHSRFDLVVVPEHDRLSGPNIISTAGALGRVTGARLDAAAALFGPALAHLPTPRVAVLVGGGNAVFQTTAGVIERMASDLGRLGAGGYGLMVTFSRRTGPELQDAIRRALAGTPSVIWDGRGDNPYFAYLALADHILVTEDSASMVSEAAVTGKPISIMSLAGGSAKFTRFHDSMRSRGASRPFTGEIVQWRYEPVDETARVAAAVRRLLESATETRNAEKTL